MSILVVGSVAFDSVETPHGSVDHCLGGAGDLFFSGCEQLHEGPRDRL